MPVETFPSIRRVILFTGDTWEHVCPVVRVISPARFAGIEVLVGNNWTGSGLELFPERISQADLVILQRDFPNYHSAYETVITKAHQHCKPIVYELDDLLLELPEDHPASMRYLPARLAIVRALKDADAVTASSQPLCEYLRQYNPNTYFLPNYLDDHFWKLRKKPDQDISPARQTQIEPDQKPSIKVPSKPFNIPRAIAIGYLGSPGHMQDLEIILPVLTRLLQRFGSRLKFRFWGFVPPSPFQKNPNVEWTQVGLVSYQQFAEYFQEQIFDICIAPLRDNLFNHSKSSIKFLEYSALGIPGVYSRITPYKGVIEEGVNGFLATSLAEWEEHLVRLIENEELRTAMGASAQESVARDWLLSNHAQEWQSVYSQISHSYHSLESTPASTYQPASVSDILRQAVHWQARLIEELIQQDETIHQLKQQLSKMSVELTGKEQAYQTAQSLYLDIMNSSSWKLMQKLIRFRLKVLPKNSRREKLVRLMFFSLQVIRREGLKAFLRGLWRRTSAALKGDRSPSAASQFQLSPAPTVTKFLHDGNKIPLPAISILTILETGKTQEPAIPDEFSLTTWCQNQTLGIEFLETATWDQTTRQAWFNQRPDQKWEAQNLLQAVKGLHGRYLCIASDDLIQQHPTYLEENLIALESEKLAFTINLNGKVSWAINQVGVNDLPGKPDDFLRQIVAIQCIQENGAWVEPEPGMNIHHLDFSTWFSGRSGIPNIVGKIIHHTTNADDLPELLPFESHLPDMEWQLVNQHLLAIPAGQATSGEPIRPAAILHPLGSFLPAQPVTDKRPTILLVQQYLAVGGAEQLALHIMEGLKDRIRFVVISIDPMDPSQGTLADSFRLLTPYVYNLPDFIEKELYLSFFEYVIERFSPATLYIANGAAAIYDLLGSIKRKYPRLRTVNQVYDNQVGWINRYAIDLITYLDAHIGANERICQAYLDKGARPGSVFQIEHAVDLRHLDPSQYTEIHKAEIRLRLGLSPAKAPAPPPRCVTFAARLNPQKRPLDFVELARRFSNDPSVEFLMVGDGPLSQTVDYQIERIGLKNIRRHRFYRPISDILAITDVLVLPSEYEGMPLIVSETLGMGKPVVVTDVGNNRYVVELTGGGYIVSKIGDISELEAGLRQVFASPPDGKLLRQIIQENFSVEVISNRYLDVLLGKNHER